LADKGWAFSVVAIFQPLTWSSNFMYSRHVTRYVNWLFWSSSFRNLFH
jgi:hypothetical protein